jgi:hypothetical protein
MNNDLRKTAVAPPDQANGQGWVGLDISREPKLFMLVEPLELGSSLSNARDNFASNQHS